MTKKIEPDEKELVKEVLSRNPLFVGLEDFYLEDIISIGELRGWPKASQIYARAKAVTWYIL